MSVTWYYEHRLETALASATKDAASAHQFSPSSYTATAVSSLAEVRAIVELLLSRLDGDGQDGG